MKDRLIVNAKNEFKTGNLAGLTMLGCTSLALEMIQSSEVLEELYALAEDPFIQEVLSFTQWYGSDIFLALSAAATMEAILKLFTAKDLIDTKLKVFASFVSKLSIYTVASFLFEYKIVLIEDNFVSDYEDVYYSLVLVVMFLLVTHLLYLKDISKR